MTRLFHLKGGGALRVSVVPYGDRVYLEELDSDGAVNGAPENPRAIPIRYLARLAPDQVTALIECLHACGVQCGFAQPDDVVAASADMDRRDAGFDGGWS